MRITENLSPTNKWAHERYLRDESPFYLLTNKENMTKERKDGYSKKQQKQLLAIKPGSGVHKVKLKTLAKRWKKSESAISQKWTSLHNTHKTKVAKVKAPRVTAPKTSRSNVSRPYADKIAPMIFESIEFVDPKVKVSQDEQLAMQKGIDSAIKDEQLSTKRAITLPKKYEKRAKEYLKEFYPQNVFSFHKDPKDKKMLLLVQKS
jgi:hypothetical protein